MDLKNSVTELHIQKKLNKLIPKLQTEMHFSTAIAFNMNKRQLNIMLVAWECRPILVLGHCK